MKALSVVVVPFEGPNKLARCLTSLTAQQNVNDLEIIVPYEEAAKDIDSLRSRFPDVIFQSLSSHRTYAALRSHGVRAARGKIIAITEDHCIPREDWAAEIVRAHENFHAAVGGAVEKRRPDSKLNWALYFVDYLRYSQPIEGPARNLTDCNVSYKRDALKTISEVWREEFHEPEVNGALRGQGMSLWITPKIALDQQRTTSFREAISDRYRFGRLFGARRAIADSSSNRWFYILATPLLPFLLTLRVVRSALSKSGYFGPLFQSLWLIFVLNVIWSWGEFTGSLTKRIGNSPTYASRQRERKI